MAQADAEPITSMIPPLGRRGFLAGLAAMVLPVSTTLAVAAPAASIMAPVVDEDPALIVFGQELDRLVSIFRKASEKLATVLERFEELRPALPDELVVSKDDDDRHWLYAYAEREKNAEGGDLWPAGSGPRMIIDAKKLRSELRRRTWDRRTRRGKRLQRALKLAEKYEAALRKARRTAGIDPAIEEKSRSGDHVVMAMENVRFIPALSLSGIRIKARAIRACREVQGNSVYGSCMIGPQIAKDILKIVASGDSL